MKFSTNDIRLRQVDGLFTFDEKVHIPELVERHHDLRKISPLSVHGLVTIDKDDYIVTFTMEGELVLPCARTLVDVHVPFSYEASEVYTEKDYLDKEDEEEEVHQITGQMIDLRPQLIENMMLKIPYRVFSDEDALEEGDGWNYFTEDEQKQQQAESEPEGDPRLSQLKDLLDEED
ncbi:MAG TPA: YceD family protein [Pseudogracilibacillus sp.]|nr:YceD family protein [Pseudogracilibacillus sp.]